MILLISIILIIILYYIINWLYKEYKEDLNNIDDHTVHAEKRIHDLENKIIALEQLVNWLYDEIERGKK